MSRIVPVHSYICSILNSSFPFLKFKSLMICFVLFSSLNSVFRSLFWIFLLLCSNKRFLFSTISWIKIDFFLKSATWSSNQTPYLFQWTNGLRCATNILSFSLPLSLSLSPLYNSPPPPMGQQTKMRTCIRHTDRYRLDSMSIEHQYIKII